MKIKGYVWVLLAVLVIGGAVGYNMYTNQQAAKAELYKTAPLARGNLTAIIGATGSVRSNQSVTLAWQTVGVIEKINVAVGDLVEKDQELITLKKASLQENIILAEADLLKAQDDMDILLASNMPLAQAMVELATAKQEVDDAQDVVDGISFNRATDNLIQQTGAKIDLQKKEVALAEDNYKRFAKRPDGDDDKAAAMLRLTTARDTLDSLIDQYNWYTGRPSELDIEQYNSDLALAKARLEDAQREVERLSGGAPESDVFAIQARIDAAKSTLDSAKIIAPFSGTVTQNDAMVGDQVTVGMMAVRIDDLSNMLVDLDISEVDVNDIEVGQPVTVSFDAISEKEYQGVVSEISEFGTVTANGVTFSVTIELVDKDELVKPGMTAAISITVKELKDVLYVQNRAVRTLEGAKVVYVLKDGVPTPIEIRLGSTADSFTEILSGDLKEGDLIILNPPSANTSPMFGG